MRINDFTLPDSTSKDVTRDLDHIKDLAKSISELREGLYDKLSMDVISEIGNVNLIDLPEDDQPAPSKEAVFERLYEIDPDACSVSIAGDSMFNSGEMTDKHIVHLVSIENRETGFEIVAFREKDNSFIRVPGDWVENPERIVEILLNLAKAQGNK